jgi:hypothetical protein
VSKKPGSGKKRKKQALVSPEMRGRLVDLYHRLTPAAFTHRVYEWCGTGRMVRRVERTQNLVTKTMRGDVVTQDDHMSIGPRAGRDGGSDLLTVSAPGVSRSSALASTLRIKKGLLEDFGMDPTAMRLRAKPNQDTLLQVTHCRNCVVTAEMVDQFVQASRRAAGRQRAELRDIFIICTDATPPAEHRAEEATWYDPALDIIFLRASPGEIMAEWMTGFVFDGDTIREASDIDD